MNNIFDFATKELSQDAFLCWFIANCNEKSISKYSYDFINFITGFNFKVGDIKKVQIKQQVDNINIIIDLWALDNLHYVIIIEDKTNSSICDGQLTRYAKIMDKWNNDKPGYIGRRCKVLYKTNELSDKNIKELVNVNKKYIGNDIWRTFDIKEIYCFFSKISSTHCEILNSYIEHIKQIYEDLHVVANKPIKEWNFNNFQTYFKKTIYDELKRKGIDFGIQSWVYQGRTASVAFYYHPNLAKARFNKSVTDSNQCFAYPLIEFIFREQAETISIYSHIAYHTNDNDCTWKYSNYDNSSTCNNKGDAKEFMELVKQNLRDIPDIKIRNMNNESNQTISVDRITLNALSDADSIKDEILRKIDAYFDCFKKACGQLTPIVFYLSMTFLIVDGCR